MNAFTNRKLKILVVDDDLDLNTGFALLLEFDGHEVDTTSAGESALEMISRKQYDLVISEYWLPRMTGDQLARQAKQLWPELPIIMTSANLSEINLGDHPGLRVDCLLEKPFTIDQLREAVSSTGGVHAEVGPDILAAYWTHDGRQIRPVIPWQAPKRP
jgi:DNA-binding response OmpR family regulator